MIGHLHRGCDAANNIWTKFKPEIIMKLTINIGILNNWKQNNLSNNIFEIIF